MRAWVRLRCSLKAMGKVHKRHKAEHKKHMKSCAFCVSGLCFLCSFPDMLRPVNSLGSKSELKVDVLTDGAPTRQQPLGVIIRYCQVR